MFSRLSEHDWKTIEKCVNFVELAPTLVERCLLPLGNRVDNTYTYRSEFIRRVRENEETFVDFASCFDTGERYDHLGHDYLACLLHGRFFAPEKLIKLSDHYEEVIARNMTKIVRGVNLKELKAHLLEKRLLTFDEACSFTSDGMEVIFRLFEILASKGPTAYVLFVECLRDEKEHVGHMELFSLITGQQPLFSPNPAKPCELACGKELSSPEYHERRHGFEKYYHSGQWKECEILAKECMTSIITEDKVIGHLELALSYVFRVGEEQVVYHVQVAEVLCKGIVNSNRTFFSGRCKYLLALLHYYKDQYAQAKKYISEAKDILFAVEVCCIL